MLIRTPLSQGSPAAQHRGLSTGAQRQSDPRAPQPIPFRLCLVAPVPLADASSSSNCAKWHHEKRHMMLGVFVISHLLSEPNSDLCVKVSQS